MNNTTEYGLRIGRAASYRASLAATLALIYVAPMGSVRLWQGVMMRYREMHNRIGAKPTPWRDGWAIVLVFVAVWLVLFLALPIAGLLGFLDFRPVQVSK